MTKYLTIKPLGLFSEYLQMLSTFWSLNTLERVLCVDDIVKLQMSQIQDR